MNEKPSDACVPRCVPSVLLAIFIGIAVFPVARGRTQDVPAADVQALLLLGQYEQAEVVARARVDAQKAEHGDGSLEVSAASDLLVRSLLLNGKGSSSSTLALAERTVQAKEARLGSTHVDLTPSLISLGDALIEAAKYGRAIVAIQRAVAMQERRARSVDLADALDHLGSALSATDRYDDALAALDRSLRIKESLLDRENVGLARTLEAIAWAHQRKANYEQAGSAIRRAAAIQEHANALHPSFVQTLNLLGLQLWFEGRLLESRHVSERAVALAERTLRPDHPTTARALKYLAGACLDLGDLAEARSLSERALATAERAYGPAHYETWAYLNDLAGPTQLLGDYPAARKLYERSLKIAEANFGPWHDSVATAVHNLALVDAHLGDYPSARREQLRATAIWERIFGRDHAFVALALTNLAAVYREQGAAAEALPLLERALTIRERRLGSEHRDVASTLADLAATLMQMNQTVRAQALAARALQIWERVGAPDSPDFAIMLGVYTRASITSRRAGLGESLLRAYSCTMEESIYGRSHPLFADTQARLARVLADLGNTAAALAAATEAENIGREHLRLMLRYLPERQSLSYAARRPKGLDLILSLMGSAPDSAALALDELIRSRALVLDEMAGRRRETGTSGDDFAVLRAQLASVQQRLANLVVRGPDAQTPAAWAALVETARSESERAESALADRSAPFRAERDRSQLGFKQVRDTVPPLGALVSFVRYERTEPRLQAAGSAARSGSAPRTITSYIVFIIKQHEPPIAVRSGPCSNHRPSCRALESSSGRRSASGDWTAGRRQWSGPHGRNGSASSHLGSDRRISSGSQQRVDRSRRHAEPHSVRSAARRPREYSSRKVQSFTICPAERDVVSQPEQSSTGRPRSSGAGRTGLRQSDAVHSAETGEVGPEGHRARNHAAGRQRIGLCRFPSRHICESPRNASRGSRRRECVERFGSRALRRPPASGGARRERAGAQAVGARASGAAPRNPWLLCRRALLADHRRCEKRRRSCSRLDSRIIEHVPRARC